MNHILLICLAGTTGLALGALFFGGLWLTVKKSATSKAPALLFIASLIIRVSITMLGFYFVSQGSWQRIVACLLGFIIARFIVMSVTKQIDNKQETQHKEVNHEV